MQKTAFNLCSIELFESNKIGLVELHNKCYKKIRKLHPNIPSQIIIKAEQECLSKYKTCRSNKHKLKKPIIKTNLSITLDKRLFSKDKKDKYSIRITTSDKRKSFKLNMYDRLKSIYDKYQYRDPSLYVKNNKIYITFPFDIPVEQQPQDLCLGVDLGVRISAATSDGRLIKDKKFNGEKRRLRFLKRKLQSKNTRSARKHLKKLKRKEHNKNKNQTHHIANKILETNANVIALENLKGIKAKKHKKQNKNYISQVPLYELRRVLTYKANNSGKHIVLVNPAYTSQTDCMSGKLEGIRKGRRFYSKNGLIYDADINAARNIGKRSKLPVSCGNILDGQGVVNHPHECKSKFNLVVQAYKSLACV
jgi:IS605 OrfB family transposase